MEDRNELHRVRTFTSRSELEKALNTLEGIFVGIAIDRRISDPEISSLDSWCNHHYDMIGQPVISELVGQVREIISDGVVTEEEQASILWFSKQIHGDSAFWDVLTADLQALQGMMFGILADGVVRTEEIQNLQRWIFENEQLVGCYPYDELSSVIASVLKDGKIDPEEENLLKVFFSEFVDTSAIAALPPEVLAKLKSEIHISGICALDPQISFEGRTFCFTGISPKASRTEIAKLIEGRSGIFSRNLLKSTNFLIYGDDTSPVWAYSCHGRKVEQAIELRKSGHEIQIVHELDFWDAIAE